MCEWQLFKKYLYETEKEKTESKKWKKYRLWKSYYLVLCTRCNCISFIFILLYFIYTFQIVFQFWIVLLYFFFYFCNTRTHIPKSKQIQKNTGSSSARSQIGFLFSFAERKKSIYGKHLQMIFRWWESLISMQHHWT